MIFIPPCVNSIVRLAAKFAAGRYMMSNLRVAELPGGWRIDATDGRVLGIVRGPSLPTAADSSEAKKLPPPETIRAEGLIPAGKVGEAFKCLPKGKNVAPHHLGVMFRNDEALLMAADNVVYCPLDTGRFPDTDAVLPKKGALVSVSLNPKLLAAVLEVAEKISADGGEPPQVEILFYGKNQPVGVTSRNGKGVTFDGIIMPLT